MIGAGQLALFVPAACLVALSPGANNLLALTHGIKAGFAPAAGGLMGRWAAFAVMIALVAVGLGSVLERSEIAFTVVKWAGVAYLAWIGLRLMTSRTLAVGAPTGPAGTGALARREFIVAITNPKAVVLFTAFLPQFISGETGYTLQLLAFGALYTAIEAVAACAYALAGSVVRRFELTPRRIVLINRVTGGMMLGAAAMLASARRSP